MDNQQARVPLPLIPVPACPVCGTEAHTLLLDNVPVEANSVSEDLPAAFREQTFRFARCAECSLVYLLERPHPEDLDVYYGKAYAAGYAKTFLFDAAHKLNDFIYYKRLQRYLRKAGRTAQAGVTLLDYGCGNAARIMNFHSFNTQWKYIACDSFLDRADAALPEEITLLQSRVDSLGSDLGADSCDIVMTINVVEHVEEPVALLKAFHTVLRAGGIVYLEFPAADGWETTLSGRASRLLHVPCHCTIPSRLPILRMAEAAGFTVLRYGNELRSAVDLAIELERRIRGRICLPDGIWNLLRLPLAVCMLPVELVQMLRGKRLVMQSAVLQKNKIAKIFQQ